MKQLYLLTVNHRRQDHSLYGTIAFHVLAEDGAEAIQVGVNSVQGHLRAQDEFDPTDIFDVQVGAMDERQVLLGAASIMARIEGGEEVAGVLINAAAAINEQVSTAPAPGVIDAADRFGRSNDNDKLN